MQVLDFWFYCFAAQKTVKKGFSLPNYVFIDVVFDASFKLLIPSCLHGAVIPNNWNEPHCAWLGTLKIEIEKENKSMGNRGRFVPK